MPSETISPRPVLARLGTVTRRTRQGIPILPYLFLLPVLLFAAVFLYYPAVSALVHSVFDWDGFTPGTFNGFDNFASMLTDPLMQRDTTNVLQLTGFSILIELTVCGPALGR